MTQGEARLKEAAKLGFARALAPPGDAAPAAAMERIEIARLRDLVALFGEDAAHRAAAR